MQKTWVIVGGGAAGFFGAIHAKETHPDWNVILIEKSAHLLSKVKISGGGRCNVTHACFDPKALVTYYPRGQKELLGAFHQFQPKDTINWFKKRGVVLKTEADGRMFPITDNSQTIIDCLFKAAHQQGVIIKTQISVTKIDKQDAVFEITLSNGTLLKADKILLATGGNKHNAGWDIAQHFGHTIEPPVPSLFTFNIKDPQLQALQGLSMPYAAASIPSLKLKTQGPILITHWGVSGPAILKLSALGARLLHDIQYQFKLHINWMYDIPKETLIKELEQSKIKRARQSIFKHPFIAAPYRLWEKWITDAGIPQDKRYADLNKTASEALIAVLSDSQFSVDGKSTHKEEFVTCGGIRLSEIHFKTLESKYTPGLYFAGEILNIDGVTGGFNFQAAWTTAWIATQ